MFAFQGRQIPDLYDPHALQIMLPRESRVTENIYSRFYWVGSV